MHVALCIYVPYNEESNFEREDSFADKVAKIARKESGAVIIINALGGTRKQIAKKLAMSNYHNNLNRELQQKLLTHKQVLLIYRKMQVVVKIIIPQ